MGETKTPHFYDFWIFEPVTKPQNQLFLSLEAPGHQKTQNAEHTFYESRNFETRNFDIFRQEGHRQMMKIRLKKSSKS